MTNSRGAVLITGANGGLGSAFASQFLKSSQASTHRGLFAVRNPSTATTLQDILSKAPGAPGDHEAIALDLSTLASVRTGAKAINDRVASGSLPPIRALVLNAALQKLQGQSFTNDGLESNFGVNYLSNFLLVLLLLQSMDKQNGRIVIVASWTHDPLDTRNSHVTEAAHKTIFADTATLAKPPIEEKKGGEWELWRAGMRRYGMSKTLMVMFMYELQRRLSADPALSNISVLSVDPGGMLTGIMREAPWLLRFLLPLVMPVFAPLLLYFQPNGSLRTPTKSAGDLLRACFDEKTLGEHPKALYLNGSAVGPVTAEARDEEKQKALWEGSLRYAGINGEETALQSWK